MLRKRMMKATKSAGFGNCKNRPEPVAENLVSKAESTVAALEQGFGGYINKIIVYAKMENPNDGYCKLFRPQHLETKRSLNPKPVSPKLNPDP